MLPNGPETTAISIGIDDPELFVQRGFFLIMQSVLICVVGGSPNAIVRSIREEPRHAHAVLICSKDSESSIAAISDQTAITDFKTVFISDAQDLSSCVEEMDRELVPLLAGLNGDSDGSRLTVDVTGGTKCMSAALALVARRWACSFRYIGGNDRSKDGLGVVKDNSERVFEYANPMDSLGYAAIEDALTLCDKAAYGAASAVLGTAHHKSSDPAIKKRLESLYELTRAFACWDLFNFKDAIARFQQFEKRLPDLSMVLHPSSTDCVANALPIWRLRLELLRKPEVSKELVEDLLANAMRRRIEGKFDDAVARLYRVIEAMAQLRLSQEHGIKDTSKVDMTIVPSSLQQSFSAKSHEGRAKLGLQDDFALLLAIGDEMGRRFESLGLSDIKRSPLQVRNKSIMAHGFEPIRKDIVEKLIKFSFELADLLNIYESDLFQFPVLQPRAG